MIGLVKLYYQTSLTDNLERNSKKYFKSIIPCSEKCKALHQRTAFKLRSISIKCMHLIEIER